MKGILFFFTLAVTSLRGGLAEGQAFKYSVVSDLLNSKLLQNASYNSFLRPRRDLRQPVIVFVDFILLAIDELAEKAQELSVLAYFTLKWEDEFVKEFFDSLQQEGIHMQELSIPAENIWTPDIITQGNSRMDTIDTNGAIAQIQATGTVQLTIGGNVKLTCSLQLRLFPLDQQLCEIELASANGHADEIAFSTVSTNSKVTNAKGEWIFISLTATNRSYIDESNSKHYSGINYKISIRRRSSGPVMAIIVPTVMQAMLVIFTFLIPPECGERVSYVITVYLALAVWSTSIYDSMPRNDDTIPLLAIGLNLLMCVSALSVVQSIITVRLSSHGGAKKIALPIWIWRCCSNGSRGKVGPLSDRPSYSLNALAATLDKVSFWTILALFVSCAAFLIVEYSR